MSQAVAGLEFKLEAPLVHRGKELRLTDIGRRLFEHAVDVLLDEQQTLEDIVQLKQGKTETLSLALSASVNRFDAPALISAYYKKNPHTRMKVAEMPSRSIISAVLSGNAEPELRPAIQRLRDQFSTVWEVSSLPLRIHMVEEGMGVTFIDRKLLEEHPSCANFRIMDDVSFGRIDKQVGLYYRTGKNLSGSAKNFIALCRRYWKL